MRGKKMVSVEVGNREVVVHESWLADISDACIIGLDLLAHWGATVDIANARLSIGATTLALHATPKRKHRRETESKNKKEAWKTWKKLLRVQCQFSVYHVEMIENGFHGNLRHWMRWGFHTLAIVYMYLTVWFPRGNANFPYNEVLLEVEEYLPADYLFKIPPLDRICDKKSENYLQVKWTLKCLIQREDKTNSNKKKYFVSNIRELFDRLNHCQVKDLSKERCHISGKTQYANVSLFKQKCSEAYDTSNDFIKCDCPYSTTAVTTTAVWATTFTQVTEDAPLSLTTLPPHSSENKGTSEKIMFPTIGVMAIVIVVLIFIHLYQWNRRPKKTQCSYQLQTNLELENQQKVNEDLLQNEQAV
ncbi:hypothetical protein AAFF_G00406770 [Aldrovandia affinis]|uniref:Uncharacterized protein n=1 Tax=Aldrovandia affinis TaxID=143900 RepID=A0AAD7SC89_9TELE|nr:hypothetical protein AAFF_G00406770 [Aldrovandia affinis]